MEFNTLHILPMNYVDSALIQHDSPVKWAPFAPSELWSPCSRRGPRGAEETKLPTTLPPAADPVRHSQADALGTPSPRWESPHMGWDEGMSVKSLLLATSQAPGTPSTTAETVLISLPPGSHISRLYAAEGSLRPIVRPGPLSPLCLSPL